MRRRTFLRTSAGFIAAVVAPNCWSIQRPVGEKKAFGFRAYRSDKTVGKVTCVTPDDGFYLHTFYDVCPWSPSGRYLAVTRFPFQTHQPKPGEKADVCVIDLRERTIETVYSTKGWGFQLGANLNWGVTDRHLYTNDIVDGQAVCVRIDLQNNETRAFAGPMYHIAPDESSVIGFPLDLINATQAGYGVPIDKSNPPALHERVSKTQGLWKTDLRTNEKKLLLSIADLYEATSNPESLEDVIFYLFHSKFNPQGTRIMQVFRGRPIDKGRYRPLLFTFNADGSDIKLAIRWQQWAPGGHHPNWHPDGEHLIMNLKPDGKTMRFCRFRYDGSDFTVLSEKRLGSGHPSVTPDGRYLVTDAYPNEPVALDNGEVPIRLVDLEADDERNVCTIYTLGKDKGKGVLRLDPHPAWNRDYKSVCFNGAPNGKRQVFIADLDGVL